LIWDAGLSLDRIEFTMSADLSRTETWSLLTLSGACFAVLINTWQNNGEPIYASIALSGVAFAMSYAIILWTGDAFMKAGRKGRDMSKKVSVEMSVFLLLHYGNIEWLTREKS